MNRQKECAFFKNIYFVTEVVKCYLFPSSLLSHEASWAERTIS